MVQSPKQQPPGRNIFLVYIPPGNVEAMVHYEDTIRQKVAPERLDRYLPAGLRNRLHHLFNGRAIAVWGSRDGDANRAKFERMQPGDDILIVEGSTIKLLGKVAATMVSADLSRELWKPLKGDNGVPWDLIYFIANPQEIDLPFTAFCQVMGYAEHFQLRGLTGVGPERLQAFYRQYDDLYSVLMLLKQHRAIHQKVPKDWGGAIVDAVPEPAVVPPREQPEDTVPDALIPDHLRMQWMLLNLGRKAGSKVWIPAGDQGRIRDRYHFDTFETDFAAGLDTQTRYVENIDVVWKEAFRIDAAFEIENSTAIYSGLLRFSDLALVAPNTMYPLFIVAPRDKRNRLMEQLRRPTFQKLGLDQKVRYLPYEAVEEIDHFFEGREQGVTVDVIVGRSEEIHLHP
ncbi:MAG: hypothetical protein ACYCOU_23890 [Sulfobacillus sp.]